MEKPEKEKLRKTNSIKDFKEKLIYLENSLKESIHDNQLANQKLLSSLDKSFTNMNELEVFVEHKFEEINDKLDLESSKLLNLSNKILESDNSERELKKGLNRIDKFEGKIQDLNKSFNSKISELSKSFMKNSDLDKIFQNQSFSNGIGEIVAQLENFNVELNKAFVKMSEFDKIFQNVNQEIKKIKENHNLLVDNYEKRITSVENKFEEFGLKNIKNQLKQYEDSFKKKELSEKQYKENSFEKRETNKDMNLEIRLKDIEDNYKVLEKTLKSIEKLHNLNDNNVTLRFHEMELRIQNEIIRFSKAFKEMQERVDQENMEFKKRVEPYVEKIGEIELYLQTFNKNYEENKLFELALLEDYKKLLDIKDQNTLSSINDFEQTIVTPIKYRSKSSTGLIDSHSNIKNLILMIESYSIQRFNQLKKQINEVSKLVEKKYFSIYIVNLFLTIITDMSNLK